MLKLWGYKPTAECPLCAAESCTTLHHELVGCKVACDQGRYAWRHDSVLLHIEGSLTNLLTRVKTNTRFTALKNAYASSFVRAGASPGAKPKTPSRSLLEGSTDWCISVDYTHKHAVFPPMIYATTERPDIVLWSESSRRVLLLELTCPAEEGIPAARDRKEAKTRVLSQELFQTIAGKQTSLLWKSELGG